MNWNKKSILKSIAISIIVVIVLLGGVLIYRNKGTKEGKWQQIGRSCTIDNKIAFQALNQSGEEVIVYEGKEHGGKYDSVYKPKEINGKLTYSAWSEKDSETTYYIVYGEKVYTDTKDYYDVTNPVEVNGEIAFEALIGGTKAEANGRSVIIYDGKKHGEKYDWASNPFSINGELGYIVKENDRSSLIVNDKEVGKKYKRVYSPVEINGELTFLARKEGKDEYVLVHGSEEHNITGGVSENTRIINVKGKPAFVSGYEEDQFVYFDGRRLKPDKQRETKGKFTPVYHGIRNIGGKVALEIGYNYCCPTMSSNPTLGSFIYYDDEEYGLEYNSARWPFEVDGKLGYVASNNGKDFIVTRGKIITEKYDYIGLAREINNRLVYLARKEQGQGYSKYSIYKEF